jgi:coenzyme F420 hydrogenase subunit beta
MRTLIHNVLKKHWTEQNILTMIGGYKQSYKGYALNDRIRLGGASGGVTTAILLYALESGFIDGALVCRTKIIDSHHVRSYFYIAQTKEELLLSQGSMYVQTKFVPEAFRLIEEFDGQLAVVGLPCDVTFLKRKMEKSPPIGSKVKFMIGLFCGHNSQEKLIDNVVEKIKPRPSSSLERFRFRTGLWRGYSLARFDGDEIVEKQFSYYSLYQNLYFFCQKKCLYCYDHFAYDADIGVGDIWSFHLKNESVKYNSIISRNRTGDAILNDARKSGYIYMENEGIEEILDGQARGAPTHNNTTAKYLAGKWFGMKIPDKHHKKVRWHEYLAAWIILFNYKWSMNKRYAGCIFKVPRKLLKAYLLVLKGLESVK